MFVGFGKFRPHEGWGEVPEFSAFLSARSDSIDAPSHVSIVLPYTVCLQSQHTLHVCFSFMIPSSLRSSTIFRLPSPEYTIHS